MNLYIYVLFMYSYTFEIYHNHYFLVAYEIYLFLPLQSQAYSMLKGLSLGKKRKNFENPG